MNREREREIEMNECMVMSYNGVLRITWFCCTGRNDVHSRQRACGRCLRANCGRYGSAIRSRGAFSYVRAKAANGAGFDLNGGSASVAYNYRDRFAIVGDFGGYRFSGLGRGSAARCTHIWLDRGFRCAEPPAEAICTSFWLAAGGSPPAPAA